MIPAFRDGQQHSCVHHHKIDGSWPLGDSEEDPPGLRPEEDGGRGEEAEGI